MAILASWLISILLVSQSLQSLNATQCFLLRAMLAPTTKLNSKTAHKADAMGHEKFEANINPTSDGVENFYGSLWHSACYDQCHKLSVGFQLLLEAEL